MGKINVAIIGVGNCASSLVQGVHLYQDAKEGEEIPGIMHPVLGDYHISDLNFVAAFDVDANKVGKDLSEAIFTDPNNTVKFTDVPHLNVPVERGMTHDGLGKYLSEIITKAPGSTADIVGILKEREVDVVISYLPVGSEEATKWYVEQILEAGCGMVNCIPVFIASGWVKDEQGEWSQTAYWRQPLPEGRPSPHRGRHQKPGRRDDPPPRPSSTSSVDRGMPHRPHLPAQLRRQHGFPQYAGA